MRKVWCFAARDMQFRYQKEEGEGFEYSMDEYQSSIVQGDGAGGRL